MYLNEAQERFVSPHHRLVLTGIRAYYLSGIRRKRSDSRSSGTETDSYQRGEFFELFRYQP